MNIRADEIVDGNPKLTLGLIWIIILHFQVSLLSTSIRYCNKLFIFCMINAIFRVSWKLVFFAGCIPYELVSIGLSSETRVHWTSF